MYTLKDHTQKTKKFGAGLVLIYVPRNVPSTESFEIEISKCQSGAKQGWIVNFSDILHVFSREENKLINSTNHKRTVELSTKVIPEVETSQSANTFAPAWLRYQSPTKT